LSKGLSANPVSLFDAEAAGTKSFDFTGPYLILGLLTLLVGFLSYKNSFPFAADVALFTVFGLLAWFIFFLGTATNHEVMAYNPASLMLFPLNFPLVIWFVQNPVKWKFYIHMVTVFSLLGIVWCGFQFWPMLLVGLPIFFRLCSLSFIKK
jgi:hypothetical protein